MSFQAYLDYTQAKTGKSPTDFKKLATEKGFLQNGKTLAKAGEVVAWLKQEYGFGHGHANALFALFKGTKKEGDQLTAFIHV